MKRTDLKPGALYAYRASQYDHPVIARLVEADRLWTKNRVKGDDGQMLDVWAPSRDTTPTRARAHFEHGSGYLALFTRDTTKAEALSSIPLPDTLTSDTVTALEAVLPAGVTLLTLNNRTLTGDWGTEHAAYEAQQAAEENARQRRQDASRGNRALYGQLAAQLTARGLSGARYAGDGTVTMPITTLAALLGHHDGSPDSDARTDRHDTGATGILQPEDAR